MLLIVLDGMSWAVCHELLADIRHEHWFEATLDDSSALPIPVIATVPSVTTYSRSDLACRGFDSKGDSSVEKRNFEANAACSKFATSGTRRSLFHKKEVYGRRPEGLSSDDLSNALSLANQQAIVGVVINAIDDRLSSAQQIRDRLDDQPDQSAGRSAETGEGFRAGGDPCQRPRPCLASP